MAVTTHFQQGPGGVIRVTPVNLPSAQFKAIDRRFRQMVADAGVKEIRKGMMNIFKNPTGAAAASIRGKVEGTSIIWWSPLAHVGAQEHGVRAHAMWYLLNKTVPIRLHGMGGEQVIFRRATLKSFMMGKWYRKATNPKHFMKKGIDKVVAQIPELLQKATASGMGGMP